MPTVASIARKLGQTSPNELPEKIVRGVKRYVLGYPTHIILQTVTTCNLTCRHCFITNYGNEISASKNIMQWAMFVKMIDRLGPAIKHAEYFQFSTFEELMHKKIFDMMDHVLSVNPKIKFPLHSNTMIVDDAMLERLSPYPVSEFTVSLDGMRKETVEAFKTGANFEKIISVLKSALKTPWGANVGVVFVLHKKNLNELPDYADFVNELGVKRIYVNNLLAFVPEFKDQYVYTPEGNPEAEEIFKETIRRVGKNGQTIMLPELQPVSKGCSITEALFIDAEGYVAPCDFHAAGAPFELFGESKQGPPIRFGNILTDDPLEIYRAKQTSTFRNAMRDGNVPEPCDHCIDAFGMMCSKRTKFGA